MLRLLGEGSGVAPTRGASTLQVLHYAPGLAYSGDLEPSTLTINYTTKPTTPNYSASLTIPAPPEGIRVLRAGIRLQLNIVSSNTYAHYAVEVNGVEVMNSQTSYGQTSYVRAGADVLPPVLALGSPNQVRLYLWADPTGGAFTLDAVECWMGVGSTRYVIQGGTLLAEVSGLASVVAVVNRVGQYTPHFRFGPPLDHQLYWLKVDSTGSAGLPAVLADQGILITLYTDSDRDLAYIDKVWVLHMA